MFLCLTVRALVSSGCMLLSLSQFCCYFRLSCALYPARHFQVDPIAFEALVQCVASADFDTCELVPAGGTANLANPLGGTATDMAGPARYMIRTIIVCC